MKNHLRTMALVPLMSLTAVALTGCYAVSIRTTVCNDVDAAAVKTELFHGVTTELYDSATDAANAVRARYDQSAWTFFEATPRSTDYWNPQMFARAEMSEPAMFSDSDNNRITAEWISFGESETGYPYWELNMRADTTAPVRPELAANLVWDVDFPTAWEYQVGPESFMSVTTYGSTICGVDTTSLRITFSEQGEISPTIRLLPPWAPPESPAPDPESLNEPEPDPVEREQVSPPEDATNPPAEEPSEPEEFAGADEFSTGTPADEAAPLEQSDLLLDAASLSDLEGKIGVATTEVSESVGLVEVDSQLLPAIALNNEVIAAGTEVRIVGTFSQGVLVEQADAESNVAFLWMWIGAIALAAGIGVGVFLMIRRSKPPAVTTS